MRLLCCDSSLLWDLFAVRLLCCETSLLWDLFAIRSVCQKLSLLWYFFDLFAVRLLCREASLLRDLFAVRSLCCEISLLWDLFAMRSLCYEISLLWDIMTSKSVTGKLYFRTSFDKDLCKIMQGPLRGCKLDARSCKDPWQDFIRIFTASSHKELYGILVKIRRMENETLARSS